MSSISSHALLSDLYVEPLTTSLENVRITLCGGGGVAAIELPKIAREFRRHGAKVRFVVTPKCLQFVGKTSLEWASAAPVTVSASGLAEHIMTDDVLVIFPLTANLCAHIAHGLCTKTATTLIQSALGQNKPILACPTMHKSLASSPVVASNRKFLESLPNFFIIPPRREEDKEKAPSPKDFVLECSHIINRLRYFNGMSPRIVINFGGTRTLIDKVRCISNLSTGRLGALFIEYAYRMGTEVTALQALTQCSLPQLSYLKVHNVPDYSSMKATLENLKPDLYSGIFFLAAVSDYEPKHSIEGKHESSHAEWHLELVPTQKLIAMPHLQAIPFRFACKLTDTSAEEGLAIARNMMEKYNLNAVLWNSTNAFYSMEHHGILLYKENNEIKSQSITSKSSIAKSIFEVFYLAIQNSLVRS